MANLRPFVSVLVPVRNEERYIERCLYSIAAQDYPRERMEAIVIDGMSADGTREIVARFAAETTLDVRVFENPARLPAPAMNIGLREARGDVVVRVDGHAALEPAYVRLCLDALERTGADCAGGALISEGDTPAGRAIAIAMSSRFGVGGAAFRVGGEGAVDTVAFGAYRRDVFNRIGAYAEDLAGGEDDELNYRLRDSGGTIILVPEARARYTVRGDLRALWRQYWAYGRAKPEVLRRHPAQVQSRQLIPPAFAVAVLAAGMTAAAGNPAYTRRLALLYTGAATTVSLDLARRHGWRYFPLLPPAFACLHLSYGLGFLAGVMGLAARLLARSQPDIREGTEVR